MRTLLKSVLATMILSSLLSLPAAAQAAPADSGVRLRVGGDIEVAADEREGLVLVIRGDGRVAGTVGTLVVIDGTATVDSGRVGELLVIRGNARLNDGAVVTGDVHLFDSKIDVSSSAQVQGEIERGVGRRFAGELFAAVALIGLGVLAAFLVAGILVALIAPTGLVATGQLIRTDIARVAGAAALLWIAFPLVAVLLIPTLVGLPIGVGYFVFAMPMLGLMGLIVSGTWIGGEVLRRINRPGKVVHPAAAAALGISCVFLVGRFPVLNLLSTVLVMLGAGAVLLVASRAVRARRVSVA